MESKAYITPAEAAALKRVSRQTVSRAIAWDAIPSTRLLRRLVVRRADVERWEPAAQGGRRRTQIRAEILSRPDRARRQTDRREPGTGTGLPISRRRDVARSQTVTCSAASLGLLLALGLGGAAIAAKRRKADPSLQSA